MSRSSVSASSNLADGIRTTTTPRPSPESSIAVDLVEEGAAPEDEKPEEVGTLARAWDDAVAGFMGVVSAVIVSSGVLLPIAVLALVVVLVVRRLLPRFDKGPATAPATDV